MTVKWSHNKQYNYNYGDLRKKPNLWNLRMKPATRRHFSRPPAYGQMHRLHGEQVWTSGLGFLCGEVCVAQVFWTHLRWLDPVQWGPSWTSLNMFGGGGDWGPFMKGHSYVQGPVWGPPVNRFTEWVTDMIENINFIVRWQYHYGKCIYRKCHGIWERIQSYLIWEWNQEHYGNASTGKSHRIWQW